MYDKPMLGDENTPIDDNHADKYSNYYSFSFSNMFFLSETHITSDS